LHSLDSPDTRFTSGTNKPLPNPNNTGDA
jgi:hypothetical protein